MTDIRLSFSIAPYDRVMPLIDGTVKPDGITLDYTYDPGGAPRLFYDQIKFQRFDLSEMSHSSYIRMRSIKWPYFMLPAFHQRMFSYTNLYIRDGSGIRQDHPEDLKGKRIGIGDYQQSVGLWTRGILQMEWGIKPEDMTWYQERGQRFSHTGASVEAGLAVPKTVKLNYVKEDFNTMYGKGEIDVTFGLPHVGRAVSSGIERSHTALPEGVKVIPLFVDSKKESIRFFKKTGVYPPHHTTALRESIVKEHPWVALSLMAAFEESKRVAIERLGEVQRNDLMVFRTEYLREVADVFGGPDPYPYGIQANAKAIDMARTFSVEQGLTERKQPLEEFFPEEVIISEERL